MPWTMGAAAVGAAALGAALTTLGRVRRAEHASPVPAASGDAIVVFGAAVREWGPTPELRARLAHAAALHAAGGAPIVLASGGFTTARSEAPVMAEHLRALGVPAAAIDVDAGGISTRHSIATAAARDWRTVLIVSSPFHVHRACAEASRQGLEAVACPAPGSPMMRDPRRRATAELRETWACWWYAVVPPCATLARRPGVTASVP
jgi:vancomycin permeability regulator SanA